MQDQIPQTIGNAVRFDDSDDRAGPKSQLVEGSEIPVSISRLSLKNVEAANDEVSLER